MSGLFPALEGHPWLQIALAVTAAIFLIAELALLIFLIRRKRDPVGQNRIEMVWTVIPALVLVGIVLLIR